MDSKRRLKLWIIKAIYKYDANHDGVLNIEET